jgi:uncharacterized membrane protein
MYPFFAIPSYYGGAFDFDAAPGTYTTGLDGERWLLNETKLSQDKEIIDYFRYNVEGQPVILEAQGDSYTDYNRVSAYTGLPTVAGWWVHQWLWRGDSEVVGRRVPDIEQIYQSDNIDLTLRLLQKYQVTYVIISELEREKYTAINEQKFRQIGTKVFESENGVGSIYQIEY